MAFWLAANRLVNRGIKSLSSTLAQRGAQIGIIVLTKAHIELTGAGNPDPVATLTEIMGKWGDETQLLPCFLNRHIAGGATCAEGKVRVKRWAKLARTRDSGRY